MSPAELADSLGRRAARDAWAAHGQSLERTPRAPATAEWIALAVVLKRDGLEATADTMRAFGHGYRAELHALAARPMM